MDTQDEKVPCPDCGAEGWHRCTAEQDKWQRIAQGMADAKR